MAVAKLKVFRTPIGFHDAYVAAPSQKAAIEAWGASKDVFSRGEAEIVTDPKLTKAPLERPGEVVKVLRGTAEEQVAALGGAKRPAKAAKAKSTKPAKPTKPAPRPSRAALDAAEAKLAEAEDARKAELKELAEQEAKLKREREAIERRRDAEAAKLRDKVEKAEAAYRAAMEKWRG